MGSKHNLFELKLEVDCFLFIGEVDERYGIIMLNSLSNDKIVTRGIQNGWETFKNNVNGLYLDGEILYKRVFNGTLL